MESVSGGVEEGRVSGVVIAREGVVDGVKAGSGPRGGGAGSPTL